MASEAFTKVRDIRIETKVAKGTDREYQTIAITGHDGTVYKGLVGKDSTKVPEKNDHLHMVYQDLNGYNSIIKYEQAPSPWSGAGETIKEENKMAPTSKENKESKTALEISGTIYYAHIKYPDTKGEFSKGDYKLDLSVSDTTKKALQDLGVDVKNKGDVKGNFITVRSKYKPLTKDSEGNELKEDEVPLIGNGSTGTVRGTLYANKGKFGGQQILGLSELKITKLIPYEGKEIKLIKLD